jgi:nuclear pore complex protein Nup53
VLDARSNEFRQVTIFGFTPKLTSYFIAQFAIRGDIQEYAIVSTGNWINITYKTLDGALAALSKNGKLWGSDLIVGVIPTQKV